MQQENNYINNREQTGDFEERRDIPHTLNIYCVPSKVLAKKLLYGSKGYKIILKGRGNRGLYRIR